MVSPHDRLNHPDTPSLGELAATASTLATLQRLACCISHLSGLFQEPWGGECGTCWWHSCLEDIQSAKLQELEVLFLSFSWSLSPLLPTPVSCHHLVC